ncbi:MAG: hypothetical protein J1D88_04735 [Treponema sp.]|nr:hypothetical protein [Treponema sp.]
MKVLLFIGLLFCLCMSGVAAFPILTRLDLYTAGQLLVPVQDMSDLFSDDEFIPAAEMTDADREQKNRNHVTQALGLMEVKGTVGARVVCRDVTVIGAMALPYTAFSDFSALGEAVRENGLSKFKPRYGISYSFGIPLVPYTFTVFAGTLRFSQSWSRLKNPRPALLSTLGTPSLLNSGLNPSLPLFSTYPPELAVAISVQNDPSVRLPTIQLGYTESGTVLAHTGMRISIPGFRAFSVSLSGAASVYGKNETTLWWFKTRPYNTTRHISLEGLCAFSVWRLTSSTAVGVHENPFGGAFWWARSQNSLVFRHWVIATSVYAADNSLITANGAQPRTPFIVAFNPQYASTVGPGRLRVGMSAQMQWCTESPSIGDELEDFQKVTVKAAATYKLKALTISTQAGGSGSTKSDDVTVSAKTTLSGTVKPLSWKCAVQGERKGSKTTLGFSAEFKPKRVFVTSVLLSAQSSIQGREITKNTVQGSLAFGRKRSFLNWTGKITAQVVF